MTVVFQIVNVWLLECWLFQADGFYSTNEKCACQGSSLKFMYSGSLLNCSESRGCQGQAFQKVQSSRVSYPLAGPPRPFIYLFRKRKEKINKITASCMG